MNRAYKSNYTNLYEHNIHASSIRPLKNNFVRIKICLQFFIYLVFLMFAGTVFSQNPLVHPKKMYQSPDGKLYIQKSLPVYVRMSTSPSEGSESYLLKSEKTPQYANPMYFDAEGFNTFRSPSKVDTVTKIPVYPQSDIIFEVYADSYAPVTTISYGKAGTRKIKDKLFIQGTSEISLKATDHLSGVENIYYSIDMAEYKIYTQPIPLLLEKEYVIKFYAVDNVGNVEQIKQVIVVTDQSKPKTSTIIKGDNFENILSGRAVIVLSTEDAGSGILKTVYRINDGPERIYSSPIASASLEQGDQKLVFYSLDQVNNKEDEVVYDFYVDKTPPTIIQELTGKSFVANGREYSSGRSQLKISTLDNKAGVKEIYYSINNGEYKLYQKPVTLANSSGSLSVKSYAIDNVNNKSFYNDKDAQLKGRNLSYVDLSGPLLSNVFFGPVFIYDDSVYISNKTKIALKGSDNESGFNHIEYTMNQNEAITYVSPFSIESEGNVILRLTGFDNVDNTSIKDFTVKVDNTGPEIYYRFSAPILSNSSIEVYPLHASIFVSATDKFTGIDHLVYSLNGEPVKAFTGYLSKLPSGRVNKLEITAFDKLGNQSRKIIEFQLQ